MNEEENAKTLPSSRGRTSSVAALLGFGAATAAAAALGGRVTTRAVRSPWYDFLKKPPFQPPRKVFPIAWTALYALMTASAWRVWRAPSSPERTRALALWWAQLGLNGAWSWIFFGARAPKLAAVEVAALFASVTAFANAARKVDRTAAWMMAPYLAWTTFAGFLNEEIAREN